MINTPSLATGYETVQARDDLPQGAIRIVTSGSLAVIGGANVRLPIDVRWSFLMR
jgi:hypothetical protein